MASMPCCSIRHSSLPLSSDALGACGIAVPATVAGCPSLMRSLLVAPAETPGNLQQTCRFCKRSLKGACRFVGRRPIALVRWRRYRLGGHGTGRAGGLAHHRRGGGGRGRERADASALGGAGAAGTRPHGGRPAPPLPPPPPARPPGRPHSPPLRLETS